MNMAVSLTTEKINRINDKCSELLSKVNDNSRPSGGHWPTSIQFSRGIV